jgi:hypothetical protein
MKEGFTDSIFGAYPLTIVNKRKEVILCLIVVRRVRPS